MKKFKIRASALGQIMTNDRSGKGMGETAKKYCELWAKEQLYARKKEIQTKYMDKGLIMEDNSIDFLAEKLGLGFVLKNEKFFENDYMTCTPDVITKDLIIDVKNSWDCFTFPLFAKQLENKDYYWQMQAYMILTGIQKSKLIYVLSDTPINLIEKEAFIYARNNGMECDNELIEVFKKKMTYTDITDEYKIKIFDIPKDEVESMIIERVAQCQSYINSLL
ncbi:hypothetical protein [Massilibacteroides sp.]|uniref:hypothetical protein n=1 Tax=Massilibacteroides sp. TaxID=2034766 RepID=UPI00262C3207|nr:hypothetical protein [Massilibacteroides sp.]MDD4515680.1 hypothetical protein [Massilibacteroides sp.]